MAAIRRASAVIVVGAFVGAPVASFFSPWRVAGRRLGVFGYVLFSLGALFAAGNFYCSFLRVPLLRLRGRALAGIRHVSGIPLFDMLIVPGTRLRSRESTA
jgi:hypothetical protein